MQILTHQIQLGELAKSTGSQRDVVYLGWPVTKSALVHEPKCCGEVGGGGAAVDLDLKKNIEI
jgi:hypothetical protein